jgi:hypothetical protein
MSKLFQGFAQLSVTPNSITDRRIVLDRASSLAQSVRETATGLQNAMANADSQFVTTVNDVNALLNRIRDFNVGRRWNAEAATDAGVDAQMHATLEDLAELVDFEVLEAEDGSQRAHCSKLSRRGHDLGAARWPARRSDRGQKQHPCWLHRRSELVCDCFRGEDQLDARRRARPQSSMRRTRRRR